MKVALKAGAEVDFLTKEEVVAALTEWWNANKPRNVPEPLWRQLESRAVSGSSGTTALIDLGTPPPGMYWDVLAYRIAPQDATTAVNGTRTTVFVQAGFSLGDLNPLGFVDFTTDLPDKGTWRPGQVRVRGEQHLLLYVTGLSNSTAVFATADVFEYSTGIEETDAPTFVVETPE